MILFNLIVFSAILSFEMKRDEGKGWKYGAIHQKVNPGAPECVFLEKKYMLKGFWRMAPAVLRRCSFATYVDVPLPPFYYPVYYSDVYMPSKISRINGDSIYVQTSIAHSQVVPTQSMKSNKFVNFLATVMFGLPTSGFENQLPRSSDFDSTWNIRSCYESFPHDVKVETDYFEKAERRNIPDECRPLHLVKSKRNYIQRLYASEEYEARIRSRFFAEMFQKSPTTNHHIDPNWG